MMAPSSMALRKQGSARTPMHLVISEKLREQIQSGVYQPGDQLPSEHDLGELFGASRTTIRRAIANLITQGLVSTQQGKGIFVKPQEKIAFSLSNPLTFFDTELKRQGVTGRIEQTGFQLVNPPPDLASRMKPFRRKSQVYHQGKIIFADQQPIAYDESYIPKDIGMRLEQQLRDGFTFRTLERYGYIIWRADVILQSTPASYEISEYLETPLGAPLLAYHYIAFAADSRLLVCGQTLSRADLTCYKVQLERDAENGSPPVESEPAQ
ncbi:MAG: GntR family transcriptional regulator [Elainellaceae cyanobacterium]